MTNSSTFSAARWTQIGKLPDARVVGQRIKADAKLNGLSSHGGMEKVGRLEPISIVVASGSWVAFGLVPYAIAPSSSILGSTVNGILALERPVVSNCVACNSFGSTETPHFTLVGNVLHDGSTCHFACLNTSDNCIARERASESLAIHTRLTLCCDVLSVFNSWMRWSGKICLQAVDCIILAVSNRASAACLSRSEARRFACAAALSAFAVSAFASAIPARAESASADNFAISVSRASSTVLSNGREIQSPPNSIATPTATNPAAINFAYQRNDNQFEALTRSEESIVSSHRISMFTALLVFIWAMKQTLKVIRTRPHY